MLTYVNIKGSQSPALSADGGRSYLVALTAVLVLAVVVTQLPVTDWVKEVVHV